MKKLYGLALALVLAGIGTPAFAAEYYGTPTDKGGTITSGGVSQTAIAQNSLRKLAFCQNPASATEDLFIAVVGAATTTGAGDLYDLAPGAGTFIPGPEAVRVNAVTTAHRYLCTEWQ